MYPFFHNIMILYNRQLAISPMLGFVIVAIVVVVVLVVVDGGSVWFCKNSKLGFDNTFYLKN